MRRSTVVLMCLLVTCFGDLSRAQDDAVPPAPSSGPASRYSTENGAASLNLYSIEITEMQFDSADVLDLTSAQIVERFQSMKKDGVVKRAETLRFSAQEQRACLVKHGKLTSLTTGTMTTPARSPVQASQVMRQTSRVEVGTHAELIITPADTGRVSIDILYESSRLDGEATDGGQPDIVSSKIETSLVVELGKTMVIYGASAEPNVFLLLTVTE